MNSITVNLTSDPWELRRLAAMLTIMAERVDTPGNSVPDPAYDKGPTQFTDRSTSIATDPPPVIPVFDQKAEADVGAYNGEFPEPPSTTPQMTAITAPSFEDVAPGIVNPGNLVLDKSGIPWDARIHSDGEKRLTADGYWKRKRNLAAHMNVEQIAAIEAELRTIVVAPSPQVTPTAAMVLPPAAPVVPPPTAIIPTLAALPPAAVVPVAAAPVVPPPSLVAHATQAVLPPHSAVPPPAPAPVSSIANFVMLNQSLTKRGLNEDVRKADSGRLAPIFKQFEIVNFTSMVQRPDIIPAFIAAVEAQFPITAGV